MSRPVRVLALATNPLEGASTRFRVVQWAPRLERAGFRLRLDAFYSAVASRTIYRRGRSAAKAAHFLAGTFRRWRTLAVAGQGADLLLVHRESLPFGWPAFLGRLRAFPGPVVYDYDDAMFLPQREGRGILSRLERLGTPAEVMALSDGVLAGNEFLADYARRHGRRVVLLPTCIDTDKFRPWEGPRPSGRCVIGWIGTHSTAKYLEDLLPLLERVAERYPAILSVIGGATPFRGRALQVIHRPWSLEREVDDFRGCDVGVYPLWDDPWAHGKCGFKAIQFMACGVPVVAAAVGVNREIIEDGVNGFLAATEAEWVEKLGWLLSDPALRDKLGRAGRRTVEERYSLDAHQGTLVGTLRDVLERAEPRR